MNHEAEDEEGNPIHTEWVERAFNTILHYLGIDEDDIDEIDLEWVGEETFAAVVLLEDGQEINCVLRLLPEGTLRGNNTAH